MFYVYLLRSQKDTSRIYVGFCNDLQRRIAQHNDPYEPTWTKRFFPWELNTYLAFEDEKLAKQFEVYLKSHSGKAFLRKHLV